MMKKITKKDLLFGGLIGLVISFLVDSLLIIVPPKISLILNFTIGLPFYIGSLIGASIFGCRTMACLPYMLIIGTIIYVILTVIIYKIIKEYKQ